MANNWGKEIEQIKAQEEAKHRPTPKQEELLSRLIDHIYQEEIRPGFETLNKFQILEQLSEIKQNLTGGEIIMTPATFEDHQKDCHEYIQYINTINGPQGVQRIIESGTIGKRMSPTTSNELLTENGVAVYKLVTPKIETHIYSPESGSFRMKTSTTDTTRIKSTVLQIISDGKHVAFLADDPLSYDIRNRLKPFNLLNIENNNDTTINGWIDQHLKTFIAEFIEIREDTDRYISLHGKHKSTPESQEQKRIEPKRTTIDDILGY